LEIEQALPGSTAPADNVNFVYQGEKIYVPRLILLAGTQMAVLLNIVLSMLILPFILAKNSRL